MRRTFTSVLIAAALAATTVLPAAAAPAPRPGSSTIAEVVIASAGEGAEFTQLLDALVYTDLAGVFAGGDQYTVFAPTDAAFAELYAALNIDSIRDLERDLVASVLLYHVTEGRRAANSVVPPRADRTITTLLSGATFAVDRSGTIRTIAGQEVAIVAPNAVSASNGIVHVVDEVLLPLG